MSIPEGFMKEAYEQMIEDSWEEVDQVRKNKTMHKMVTSPQTARREVDQVRKNKTMHT